MTEPCPEERDLQIAYRLVPFLSPARIRLLDEHFASLTAVRRASSTLIAALLNVPEERARVVKDPLQVPAIRRHAIELRSIAITRIDDAYPPLLAEIADPPTALFVTGNRSLLRTPSIAIVGSRNASRYGIDAAAAIARDLAGCGVTVVSGLARGIDAAAHRAALEAGGSTVAVLGAGLDVRYPRGNERLRARIEREGLVVTEFAPGTPPRRENFPVRNRIIAGLASGTIVVEATRRSGSLITARLAAEQGREVFAVPGSIFSSRSEGPNRLVQYGAKLVVDVDDVLDELGPLVPRSARRRPESEEPPAELRDLWTLVDDADPIHVDSITAASGRSPGDLAETLLRLELGGWIRSLPGGYYVRSAGS